MVRSAFSGDRKAASENGVVLHLAAVSGHAFKDLILGRLEIDDLARESDVGVFDHESGLRDPAADALGALLLERLNGVSPMGRCLIRFLVQ